MIWHKSLFIAFHSPHNLYPHHIYKSYTTLFFHPQDSHCHYYLSMKEKFTWRKYTLNFWYTKYIVYFCNALDYPVRFFIWHIVAQSLSESPPQSTRAITILVGRCTLWRRLSHKELWLVVSPDSVWWLSALSFCGNVWQKP